MSKAAEWNEIMATLRGRKLAVYDELASGMHLNVQDLRVQEALGWLVYHRFIWKDGDHYQVRPTNKARDLYWNEGPARTESADVARYTPPAPKPVVAPSIEKPTGEPAAAGVRSVHASRGIQPELFP